ncbi:hypothetical protein D9M71_806610 [compost metagenome]
MAADVVLSGVHHRLRLAAHVARRLACLAQLQAHLGAQRLCFFADQCGTVVQQFFRFFYQRLQFAEYLVLDLIAVRQRGVFPGHELVLVDGGDVNNGCRHVGKVAATFR